MATTKFVEGALSFGVADDEGLVLLETIMQAAEVGLDGAPDDLPHVEQAWDTVQNILSSLALVGALKEVTS